MAIQPPPSDPESWVFTITDVELKAMIEERRQVLTQLKELRGRLEHLNKVVAAAEFIATWSKNANGNGGAK